ncbi:MAG: hypothetical protein JSS10_06625 [Verrucomicrobia bacterium]|nr:hypothetical protein [Verrucomicrobiota bacterium]
MRPTTIHSRERDDPERQPKIKSLWFLDTERSMFQVPKRDSGVGMMTDPLMMRDKK